jgi:hypothetical protein
VHVTVDPTSASGFNGLPDVWEKSLMQSKISKEEIMENPDAMLEVLKFACEDNAQVPMPRHSVAVMQLSAGVQFKSSDPTSDYGKLTQQLGKGGAGTIFMGTKKKEPFAIKVLPISRDTDMAALTTEIAIMSSTKHPCCVQYCPPTLTTKPTLSIKQCAVQVLRVLQLPAVALHRYGAHGWRQPHQRHTALSKAARVRAPTPNIHTAFAY